MNRVGVSIPKSRRAPDIPTPKGGGFTAHLIKKKTPLSTQGGSLMENVSGRDMPMCSRPYWLVVFRLDEKKVSSMHGR